MDKGKILSILFFYITFAPKIKDRPMYTGINTRRQLLIRVGNGTLSFSTVEDTADGQGRVVYEPYTVKSGISMSANLREAFKTASLPAVDYGRASVAVDAPVLMIPLDLYHEEELPKLYAHSFPQVEGSVVLPCVLPALNAVAAFAVNKDLKLVVDDRYADARFSCVSAPVWSHLHLRSYVGSRVKVFGYFHDKRLDVFSFAQNRFKFFNVFDTVLPQDAVYFLLSVWKLMRLNAENDELHLVGDIPDRDALLAELRGYVRRVYALNPSSEFNRAPVTQIKAMPYDLMTYYMKS